PAAAEAAMRTHIIGAANRVGVKLPLSKTGGTK
ncbi:MAG: FadR family transcriptional regulator, partial [Mesorhizobium sp.]